MIQRNVHVASATTRELAYNTFVCPHLEYASVVWSPWQAYLEEAIEKVQRRVARYVCNKHGVVSVTGLISDLKWDTLKLRRIKSSLCSYYCTVKKFEGKKTLANLANHNNSPTFFPQSVFLLL